MENTRSNDTSESSETRMSRVEQMLAVLIETVMQQQRQQPLPLPPPPAQNEPGNNDIINLTQKFMKMKPPTFLGSIEPLKAETWLLEMEKLFKVFPYFEIQKVLLATYTLKDKARRWWLLIRNNNGNMTWAQFNAIFYDKYFPQCFQDRKVLEFQELKQANMSVAEYEAKYTELARFAPYIVDTDYEKARKFEGGLDLDILDRVGVLNLPTYVNVLDRALMVEAILAAKKQALVLTSYYRRFVKDFSKLALPLAQLTQKATSFDWTDQRETAFRELKTRLVTTPILTLPNGTDGFQIYSDASYKGLGCIMYYPGKANTVADALSRKSIGNLSCLLTGQKELLCDLEKNEIEVVLREQGGVLAAIFAQLAIIEEVREKQLQDEFLKKIVDEIDSKPRPGFVLENKVLKF
ncbi:uncharacterized protein LOC114266814 [Camellia sinensis]|uniref:uncharacterized protein LOC114266814 n=1 Tax=Camellia sinensis TaxID=4442 RepID=UPI001036C978|nr:uncharacterized protein LOC114266814 [Camellia sinensis]